MSSAREEQWYTNKDLFEMVQELQTQMAALSAQMKLTCQSLQKYNGLRERLALCEQKIAEHEGQGTGGRNMWGYVVGGLGTLFALLAALGVI